MVVRAPKAVPFHGETYSTVKDLNLFHCKLFHPLITSVLSSNFSTLTVKFGCQDGGESVGTAVPNRDIMSQYTGNSSSGVYEVCPRLS